MRTFLFFFSGLIIFGLVFTSTSCRKETDCKATVRCVDSVGNNLGNAYVQLFALVKDPADPKGTATFTADVKANGNTDASGEVKFTFKLPAIYDIRGSVVIGTRTVTGAGIIKLEEGKSVSKTVTLK